MANRNKYALTREQQMLTDKQREDLRYFKNGQPPKRKKRMSDAEAKAMAEETGVTVEEIRAMENEAANEASARGSYKKGGMAAKRKAAEKVGEKIAPKPTKQVADRRREMERQMEALKREMGGRSSGYNKGGMVKAANCGASMKPTQKSTGAVKMACGGMSHSKKGKK